MAGGAHSEIYTGTIRDDAPTARPIMTFSFYLWNI
jgi:hypothetical protein